jgi:hypothetical protein
VAAGYPIDSRQNLSNNAYLPTETRHANTITDRELHHFVTGASRFRIVQIVLHHTDNLPTAYEITQFCPTLTSEDIEERLAGLVEKELVEAVRLAPADRQDDSPDTFYVVTD